MTSTRHHSPNGDSGRISHYASRAAEAIGYRLSKPSSQTISRPSGVVVARYLVQARGFSAASQNAKEFNIPDCGLMLLGNETG